MKVLYPFAASLLAGWFAAYSSEESNPIFPFYRPLLSASVFITIAFILSGLTSLESYSIDSKAIILFFQQLVHRKMDKGIIGEQANFFLAIRQSIDKVDALPSKVCKQSFDGNINLL